MTMRETSVAATRPRTPDAEPKADTRGRILKVALELFFERGYSQTSVAMVARTAGVSNSAYYRYFRSKEDILFSIVESFADDTIAALEAAMLARSGLEGKLDAFYGTMLGVVGSNTHLYRVFTETEFNGYVFVQDFYRRLVDVVAEQLDGLVVAGMDRHNIGYYLLGTVYLVGVKKTLWEASFHTDSFRPQLVDLAQHGIDARGDYPLDVIPLPHDAPRATPATHLTKGELTEKRILAAAERVFGANGYWNSDMYTIAREAGVAPGTTYLYFESKLELLSKLVVEVNEGLRRNTARAIHGIDDRRGLEVAALEMFCDYIREHGNSYRIIREAEFVDKDLGRWYYSRLSEPYAVALERAMTAGVLRRANPEIMALALMGVGHWLGLRWVLWSKATDPAVPLSVQQESTALVLRGLNGLGRHWKQDTGKEVRGQTR